jgi:hypothetical protein
VLGVKEDDMVEFPYADYGVSTFGNSIVVKPEWAAAHADTMRAFIKRALAGIKGSIADTKYAISSLKKFNTMLDDKIESTALDFSNARAIVTDDLKKYGLSAMEPKRLDRVLGQVADALQIPKTGGERCVDGCLSAAGRRVDVEMILLVGAACDGNRCAKASIKRPRSFMGRIGDTPWERYRHSDA